MSELKRTATEEWTLVVQPKSGWFDLHLADIWRYRDLIAVFVRRDFVAVYKQTILGPFWFVIQPLCATFLYLFVFSGIAHISTGNMPNVLFYLSGLTVWNYFASCFVKTSNTFVSNSAIFGKVYFPRLAAPISSVISTLITFFIQLILFLSFLLFYILFKGTVYHLSAYLLLIPYLVVIMAILGLGSGIIISSLTTKYRDLTNLVGFGVQLLMFLSAVVYPLSYVKGKFRLMILLNPMTSIIESFRYAFFPDGNFSWQWLGYSTLFTLVILFIGILLFSRVEKSFMDTV